MSENRVIGADGRIPWRLPEDFKWFKQSTMGGIVVMGRKTFESIGSPLPGRETIVLSRASFECRGVKTVPDLPALDAIVQTDNRPVWVCGGSEIYRLLLPRCHELILTRVHRQVKGDAHFPPFEDEFAFDSELLRTPDFHVDRFLRRTNSPPRL
jgi:dihydrofolate reductase